MSLGRSSDGRLFTRDGRLCVGCCSGLPCDPFNRCIPYSDTLGCTLDFGEAYQRWRVGIEVTELFYEVNFTERNANNGGNFPTIRNAQETRIDEVNAPAWSGVVSVLGDDELVLCGQVTPDATLRGRFQRVTNGTQDNTENGVTRVFTFSGGWETVTSLTNDQGVLRRSASAPTGQDPDSFFMRMLFRVLFSSPSEPIQTTFRRQASSVVPAGSSATADLPSFYISQLADWVTKELNRGSTCQRSGSRTLTGFSLSNGTWFPQFNNSGLVFQHRPIDLPVFTALITTENENPTLPDPPPSEFSETYSLSATPTTTGFALDYTHNIRSRKYRSRATSQAFVSEYYLYAELDESRTVRINYTIEPVGDCPPPGVSGFFA